MKNFLLFLIAVLLFTACQKQHAPYVINLIPTANFTTDKTTYMAGEIIHCTDASKNALHWKWTMPDGKIYTTKNVDFATDTNDVGGDKTITLEVASNNPTSIATISKKIMVNQMIYANDSFFQADQHGNKNYFKIVTKTTGVSNGHWYITLTNGGTSINYSEVTIGLDDVNTPTSNRIYSISANEASIEYLGGGLESTREHAISGQLNLTILPNKKLHFIFSNIPSTLINDFYAGNITCH